MPRIRFREITNEEAPQLLDLIRALEEAEGFPFDAPVTVERLQKNLISADGPGVARFVVVGDEIVGYVVYYFTFSTAEGKRGLHLDDLFIKPEHRKSGYGMQSMEELAKIAVEKDCARFEWWTLRWNDPAKEFYKALKAGSKDDILIYRLNEGQICELASKTHDK